MLAAGGRVDGTLVREIAGLSGPPIAAMLLDYLERSPAQRSLQVMGGRGIDYRWGM